MSYRQINIYYILSSTHPSIFCSFLLIEHKAHQPNKTNRNEEEEEKSDLIFLINIKNNFYEFYLILLTFFLMMRMKINYSGLMSHFIAQTFLINFFLFLYIEYNLKCLLFISRFQFAKKKKNREDKREKDFVVATCLTIHSTITS